MKPTELFIYETNKNIFTLSLALHKPVTLTRFNKTTSKLSTLNVKTKSSKQVIHSMILRFVSSNKIRLTSKGFYLENYKD